MSRLRKQLAIGVAAAVTLIPITAVPTGAAAAAPRAVAAESCNIWTQLFASRYEITASSEQFLRVGAISTANNTNGPIPLYQSLSTTQTITASASLALSYSGVGGAISGSYSLSWTLGQAVGPYNIDAGESGRATYGFNVQRFTGNLRICMPWGRWSDPIPFVGISPLELHVVIERYPNGQAPPAPIGIPTEQAMTGLVPMFK